jgi:sugar phosphate isomerase/epimerase
MRLACQEHLLPGDGIGDKWKFARGAGYDAIELHGHGDFAFRARRDELLRARDSGAVFSSVCVIMDHFIGDFDAGRRRDAVENMQSLLTVIAELGGVGAITPASFGMFSAALPPFRPPRSADDDRAVLLEGLAELCGHAEEAGVLLLLEPLNRYEDHMLNRLAQGVDLCQAVGSPAARVMGDLFHMNIEEDDPPRSIREAGEWLAHVHLADSNRAHPGAGHLDFRGMFAALASIGFDGYLALECGVRGDPRTVLPEVARRLRGLIDEARAGV